MTELSVGEITALKNLAGKQSGEEVGWIKISDAMALTRRGLAERSREGWTLTALGSEALAKAIVADDGGGI